MESSRSVEAEKPIDFFLPQQNLTYKQIYKSVNQHSSKSTNQRVFLQTNKPSSKIFSEPTGKQIVSAGVYLGRHR